jgi:hypothetical protein
MVSCGVLWLISGFSGIDLRLYGHLPGLAQGILRQKRGGIVVICVIDVEIKMVFGGAVGSSAATTIR